MRAILCSALLILLSSSCGYRFPEERLSEEPVTISVPYIKGDVEGQLNTELVRILAQDPRFDYRQKGGTLTLEVAVISDGNERVGYRYDRSPSSGKRRQNIIGTENRRTLNVEVKLIDSRTQEVLIGPVHVKGEAEYDYIDSDSIRDLTFENAHGAMQTIMTFSMGQLDSVEGAHDATASSIYRQLAEKIVDGLVAHGW